jgi:hypothetical protein
MPLREPRPGERCQIATVDLAGPSVAILSGFIGELRPDGFSVNLSTGLDERRAAGGSPVLVADGIVGVVGSISTEFPSRSGLPNARGVVGALSRRTALPVPGVVGIRRAGFRRDGTREHHGRRLWRREDALVRLAAARGRQRCLWLAAGA